MSFTWLNPIQPPPEPAELPPAFDWGLYVTNPRNADLANHDKERATHHYEWYGRDEGRVGGAIDGRGAFLGLVPASASLLEIGPGCNPGFPSHKGRRRYLDAFPTEELRRIASDLNWGEPELVPDIDYVWRGERYVELIKESFDVVFSCHNIEHQPCLVTHLRNVASVLKRRGRMFLIISDRRYCSNYYLAESTIAEVLDAFLSYPRRRHSARSILERQLLLTHNESEAHWNGHHGPDPRRRAPDADIVRRITENLQTLPVRDGYIDTHAWRFVPESFAQLIGTLKAAGLTPFEVERVYPTLRSNNEFYAVLGLPADGGGP